MYAKLVAGLRRHPRLAAVLAVLIMTATAGSAMAQETGIEETARGNCVAAMEAFPERVPDPVAMCSCMVGEVSARFTPRSAETVIRAMANTSPDQGPWVDWTEPPALKAAGDLSQQDAAALSQAVRERLGGDTQRRCANATPADQTQSAEPRADAPTPADAAEVCQSESCFTSRFRQCQPAIFTEDQTDLGTLQIELLGPDENRPGDCRVRVWFTSHPDPEWTNSPLIMTLQADAPFTPQYREAIETCLTTNSAGDFNCTGPLRGIAN